jgi:transposase
MRWHGRRVQVYAYTRPADMRKGFDGLCALVTQGLQRDVLGGDIFIFIRRDRIRAKTLQWDGTGVCLYAKRLERGRFAPLWREAGDDPITLTISSFSTGARWWVGSRSRRRRSRSFRLQRITSHDQLRGGWWS